MFELNILKTDSRAYTIKMLMLLLVFLNWAEFTVEFQSSMNFATKI